MTLKTTSLLLRNPDSNKPEASEVAGFPTETRVTREIPPDTQLQVIIGECIGGSVPVIFSSLGSSEFYIKNLSKFILPLSQQNCSRTLCRMQPNSGPRE